MLRTYYFGTRALLSEAPLIHGYWQKSNWELSEYEYSQRPRKLSIWSDFSISLMSTCICNDLHKGPPLTSLPLHPTTIYEYVSLLRSALTWHQTSKDSKPSQHPIFASRHTQIPRKTIQFFKNEKCKTGTALRFIQSVWAHVEWVWSAVQSALKPRRSCVLFGYLAIIAIIISFVWGGTSSLSLYMIIKLHLILFRSSYNIANHIVEPLTCSAILVHARNHSWNLSPFIRGWRMLYIIPNRHAMFQMLYRERNSIRTDWVSHCHESGMIYT